MVETKKNKFMELLVTCSILRKDEDKMKNRVCSCVGKREKESVCEREVTVLDTSAN